MIDLIVATMALLIFAPVMLLVAIAIVYESGTPIFFRQRRLGQHGHCFLILKFKKFRNDVDPSGPHLTSRDDRRMTQIGAFLQRTKLDELPQFFNVLRGEMAIIGPRPESLRFADCFGGRYEQVLAYRPGIFGPNQILFRHEDALFAGRSEVESYYRQILFPLKAAVDLTYFPRRTIASDMRLLIDAVGAICGSKIRAGHLDLGAPHGEHPDVRPRAASVPGPFTRWFSHRRTDPTQLDRSGAAS